MGTAVTRECQVLAELQCGVISRSQALACGMADDAVDRLLRSRRWQPMRRGVYSVFTGPPTRQAALWAAVHSAGSGAALSHQTAAELSRITDQRSSLIHVTIPWQRKARAEAGIVIHRSTRLAAAVHPTMLPPRIRVEETVLDLADLASTFDAAFNLACAACQRRLTTTSHIAQAMGLRRRMRWRNELSQALGLIGSGVHSLLEYRYVNLVERPHDLPQAARQVRVADHDQSRYLDNLYEKYKLCVELDGLQAHPDDRRWADLRRINAITEHGVIVLRYGWADVSGRPCQTAAQIASVLRQRGWPGPPSRCGPACALIG